MPGVVSCQITSALAKIRRVGTKGESIRLIKTKKSQDAVAEEGRTLTTNDDASGDTATVRFTAQSIGIASKAVRLFAGALITLASASEVSAQNLEPIPSFYQDPGISPNREYVNQHFAETIDPFTGKLQFHYVDLFLPGNGGMDIKVQRSYSSGDGELKEPGPFAVGWTLHFGRIIRRTSVPICQTSGGTATNPVLELTDGSRQIMYTSTDKTYLVTQSLWKGICDPTGKFLIVSSPDGTVYSMSVVGPTVQNTQASYYPATITDRNGNALTLTYFTSAPSYFGPLTISATDGRKVTFAYTGNVISSVTDGTNTFTYTTIPVPSAGPGYNYLTKVMRPDAATWQYAYTGQTVAINNLVAGSGSINQITYPTGGVFNYTYQLVNFNNSLVPAHAIQTKVGDGGTTTYNFTPATVQLPSGDTTVSCPDTRLDVTTVVAPDATKLYCHVGFSSVVDNTLYLVGTNIITQVGSSATGPFYLSTGTDIEGGALITSSQSLLRPQSVLYDLNVYAPIPAAISTNRYGQLSTVTYNSYDPFMNPTSITEVGTTTYAGGPDNRATTSTWYTDSTKWILHKKWTDAIVVNGASVGTIGRTFDGNANVLSENKFGTTTSWTYDSAGDVASKTDANGNKTLYPTYKLGIAETENRPLAETITRVVDNLGNVTSETDPTNATTQYAYDSLNRLTRIIHSVGNAVSIGWTPTARSVTRGAFNELTTFDGFGREIAKVDSDSNTGASIAVNTQYDSVGRKIFTTNPNDTVGTQYDLDNLGEIVDIKYGTNGLNGAYSAESYHGTGNNVVYDENEDGYTYARTYRWFGDPSQRSLISVTAPDPNANVTMTRNGLDQLLTVSQSTIQTGGTIFTRNYGYNSQYFLTSKVDPETGTTTYTRDTIGNMKSSQTGASGTTNYVYDALNRLTNINYPTGTPSVTKTYWLDDRLKSAFTSVATRSFVYDANKNLTSDSLVLGSQTYITQYGYNANDALSQLTFASGAAVTYAPDAFGRPTTLAPYATAISWYPHGFPKSIQLESGATTSYQINNRLWPTSMLISASGTTISNQGYGYDSIGAILQVSDSVDGSQDRSIATDALNRISTVYGTWPSSGYAQASVSYDGTGNILATNFGPTLTYTYSPTTNLLTSIAGPTNYTFTYDTYGNVINNGVRTFSYNDAIDMTCSNCGTAQEVDYAYDGLGTRVSSTPKGGQSTYFVSSVGGDLLTEFQPNSVVKDYVYLLGKQVAVREQAPPGSIPTYLATSLTLAGTVTANSVAVGGFVTYTLTVTNAGVNPAQAVSVSDVLPPNQSAVNLSSACSEAGEGATITCAIGALAPGASQSFQIIATATAAGANANVATITATTPNTTGGAATSVISVTAH